MSLIGAGHGSRLWRDVYELTFNGTGPAVTLLKDRGLATRMRLHKEQAVEVGYSYFDEQVVVEGESEADIRVFLTPARRQAVLAIT